MTVQHLNVIPFLPYMVQESLCGRFAGCIYSGKSKSVVKMSVDVIMSSQNVDKSQQTDKIELE